MKTIPGEYIWFNSIGVPGEGKIAIGEIPVIVGKNARKLRSAFWDDKYVVDLPNEERVICFCQEEAGDPLQLKRNIYTQPPRWGEETCRMDCPYLVIAKDTEFQCDLPRHINIDLINEPLVLTSGSMIRGKYCRGFITVKD